jgi:hypothetical protein
VTPATLSGHAAGCESLGDKFGKLSELLHQARVDDQCFGPIGDAVGISSKYFESLEQCQELATKAQRFLQKTKQSLDETLQDHQDNDQQISDLLSTIGKELGA